MNQQVDRRTCDRDPIDVLTPEVFALLKFCGGVRAGDIERVTRGNGRGASQDRRGPDRRTPVIE
jgi:hypothetical protein